MKAEQRIVELGVTLPPPSAPAGNYTTAVRTGNLLYLSGKAPSPVAGVAPKGKLGQAYTAADGYALARSAGLELIGMTQTDVDILRYNALGGRVRNHPEARRALRGIPLPNPFSQVWELRQMHGMYAAAVVLLTWTALVVAWNAGRGPRLTSWGRGPRT